MKNRTHKILSAITASCGALFALVALPTANEISIALHTQEQRNIFNLPNGERCDGVTASEHNARTVQEVFVNCSGFLE